MDSILILGILIILWLQDVFVGFVGPMKFFSFLGVEEFYLLVAPAIFWCFDPAFGLKLGIGLMVSGATNGIFKLLFHGPRPYWYDERVLGWSSETSFGVPSGHSQNAVVVWGLIADRLKRGWAWAIAIFLILMIGISRMYLGVHFPTDVLAGWFFGAVILWLFIRFDRPVTSWILRQKPTDQILVALVSSLVLILIAALAQLALGAFEIPASWIELAGQILDAEAINPLSLSGVVSTSATLFGMGLGAVLLSKAGWMDVSGPAWQRLLRYLLGLVGVLVLWSGLDQIFPEGDTLIPYIFRYIRYASIGVWIMYLAPLVFFRLKLAKKG